MAGIEQDQRPRSAPAPRRRPRPRHRAALREAAAKSAGWRGSGRSPWSCRRFRRCRAASGRRETKHQPGPAGGGSGRKRGRWQSPGSATAPGSKPVIEPFEIDDETHRRIEGEDAEPDRAVEGEREGQATVEKSASICEPCAETGGRGWAEGAEAARRRGEQDGSSRRQRINRYSSVLRRAAVRGQPWTAPAWWQDCSCHLRPAMPIVQGRNGCRSPGLYSYSPRLVVSQDSAAFWISRQPCGGARLRQMEDRGESPERTGLGSCGRRGRSKNRGDTRRNRSDFTTRPFGGAGRPVAACTTV